MASVDTGVNRWVSIEASSEVVFGYLADLSRHGEWDELSGFVVVGTTERPIAEGYSCDRQRVETFLSPVLRGGQISNQVTWTKRLTVVVYEPNRRLDFETKNLYNGLSFGSELVSFRLVSEGSSTVLVMINKKNPHLPGPFHIFMMGMDSLRSWISKPIVGACFRAFPSLRVNRQLKCIKETVELI